MQILQIETINACNARCGFCPVKTVNTRRAPMGMPLFKNIVDQAKELKPTQVMPFLNGEPLLDKLLCERIAYVNEVLPESGVVFYTNGSLLSPEKIAELKNVRLAGINISINAVSETGRQAVMGLSLDETIANIANLHNTLPDLPITASCIVDTAYISAVGMQEFWEFWSAQKIQPSFFYNGNWAGKTRPVVNVEGSCQRPEDVMTILSDGTVALCCYDLLGEVSFGDVNEKPLKEIWECSELEDYRMANLMGRRNELKLCKDCTLG